MKVPGTVRSGKVWAKLRAQVTLDASFNLVSQIGNLKLASADPRSMKSGTLYMPDGFSREVV